MPPEPKKPEVKKAEKRPDKKPEKKKPKLDLTQVSALLNKIDGEPSRPKKSEAVTGTPKRGTFDSGGTDQRLAATILDAMRQKIESCWTIPAGAREAERLLIKLEIKLAPDQTHDLLGYYSINADKLRALDATALAGLHAKGFLECAYLLIGSVRNVQHLIDLKLARLRAAAAN